MKLKMTFNAELEEYRAEPNDEGKSWSLKREYGKTPNGNPINGFWVLRDPDGKFIDYDQSRNDLEFRRNLKLIGD